MTAFLGITDAIRSALAAAPPIGPVNRGTVQRGSRQPIGQNDTWGVRINAVRHEANPIGELTTTALQWTSQVVVAVHARATAAQDAEQALDPLLLSTWQRLSSMTMPAGVQGATLDPLITVDLDDADLTVATASLGLRITHVTTGAALAA